MIFYTNPRMMKNSGIFCVEKIKSPIKNQFNFFKDIKASKSYFLKFRNYGSLLFFTYLEKL